MIRPRILPSVLLGIAVFFLICSPQGAAMAFFSKKEVVLSSPFAAQITYEGKPASGARIKRIIKWQSQVGEEDVAEADDQGHFSFPAVRDSWRQLLPAEFVVYQDIVVQYQGQEFKIWIGSKREEHEWSELGGRPINMQCELTDEIRRVDVKRGLLGTNCHWEGIEVR